MHNCILTLLIMSWNIISALRSMLTIKPSCTHVFASLFVSLTMFCFFYIYLGAWLVYIYFVVVPAQHVPSLLWKRESQSAFLHRLVLLLATLHPVLSLIPYPQGHSGEFIINALTLVLLKCFNCIFRHLKLELLTQFPASNDEKYSSLWKINISWASTTEYFINFSGVLFGLKLSWKRIYRGLNYYWSQRR